MEDRKDSAASRPAQNPAPEYSGIAPDANGAPAAFKSTVTPAEIAEVLRRAGYRATVVEGNGGPQVQSAVQGLGFFIGFGNAQPGAELRYVDFSFHCWLGIHGELPPRIIESWNRTKRFARLFRQDQVLVLSMDVLLAGGVSADHLQAQCEIWDHLIRDLMLHLRQTGQAQTAVPRTAAEA